MKLPIRKKYFDEILQGKNIEFLAEQNKKEEK